MEKERLMLGIIDEEGYEKDNRVYWVGGCCPTLTCGNALIKVLRKYEKDNLHRKRIDKS